MTTATYPTSIVNFGTDKQNVTDLVYAADPNTLRAEVVAIESAIGAIPAVSTAATGSGWLNNGSTFSNVSARLGNIEAGVVADAHSQYLRKTSDAGNVVTAGSSILVPVTISGVASQSAHLTDWKNSSGTVLSYIDAVGNFFSPSSSASVAGLQDVLMLMGS